MNQRELGRKDFLRFLGASAVVLVGGTALIEYGIKRQIEEREDKKKREQLAPNEYLVEEGAKIRIPKGTEIFYEVRKNTVSSFSVKTTHDIEMENYITFRVDPDAEGVTRFSVPLAEAYLNGYWIAVPLNEEVKKINEPNKSHPIKATKDTSPEKVVINLGGTKTEIVTMISEDARKIEVKAVQY